MNESQATGNSTALENYESEGSNETNRESSSRNNQLKQTWSRYKNEYQGLVQLNQQTTQGLQALKQEHHHANERLRKLLNRRQARVDLLESENSQLRKQIASSALKASSSNNLQNENATAKQTVDLLADDNRVLGAKIQVLQRELENETARVSHEERDKKMVAAQLDQYKQQLLQQQQINKDNEQQLSAFQTFLGQMDEGIIWPIRELSRLSEYLQDGDDERVKAMMEQHVLSLINTWRKVELDWVNFLGENSNG